MAAGRGGRGLSRPVIGRPEEEEEKEFGIKKKRITTQFNYCPTKKKENGRKKNAKNEPTDDERETVGRLNSQSDSSPTPSPTSHHPPHARIVPLCKSLQSVAQSMKSGENGKKTNQRKLDTETFH